MAKRRKTSGRKTYRKKTTARKAAKKSGRKIYKVKGGYRLGKK
jgi:hypothetical protein